jgi:hypothetical protein
LKDHHGRHFIYYFFFFSACLHLLKSAFFRPPLSTGARPKARRELETFLQALPRTSGSPPPSADGSIHVFGKTEYNLVNDIVFRQFGEAVQAVVTARLVDFNRFYPLSRPAHFIAQRYAERFRT